ncbi:hypothetical protein AAC387_Pa02g1488 [Persea americana]
MGSGMSKKPNNSDVANVVDIDSSEEEEGTVVAVTDTWSAPAPISIESRCFWKGGAYEVVSNPQPVAKGQLEHARVHPKFLHSNATSHKWAFGAIAELLDNAVDEICSGATYVKVDKIYNARDHSPALLFQDDGGGMDPECMRQCMSLGYSTKKSNTTIGQYGNGFKTSTMRLGADVIVFSRKISGSRVTQSIGLLSYTFLRRTGQDDIIVPMVDFEIIDGRAQPIIYSSQDDWIDNFKIILEWSPFSLKEELMQQFEDIAHHGTKVIIYNLWLNDDGIFELDFDDDDEDIRLRDEAKFGNNSKTKKEARNESHISYRIRYSLREYASILYHRKFENFLIILRGKPVQQHNIADELQFSKVIPYRPNLGIGAKEVSVEIRIGFLKEAPFIKANGFNVYHKNRLIVPFWRVLHEGSSRGNGVMGVLEANFIEPAHDKQDFERTPLLIRLETRLKQMILDYWKSHIHLIGLQQPSADIHKELSNTQPVIGLAGNSHKSLPVDEPLDSQATNFQKASPMVQPVTGLAAVSRVDTSAHNTSSQSIFFPQIEESRTQAGSTVLACVQDPVQQSLTVAAEFREGFGEKVTNTDVSSTLSAEKLGEENLQLLLRCEEHRRKQKDLKQTIANLESQIAEARNKCSLLGKQLEIRRKQKTVQD